MIKIKNFETVLIANRGEIAARVIRSAKALGLRTTAVFTQADKMSPHVADADQSIDIGSGPVAESYLSIEKIISAARKSGSQAIHPGYGFLSENAEFAKACEEAGFIFVGPSSKAIELMGNKAQAKRIMKQAKVPCVPGQELGENNGRDLVLMANSIGFPLMIKAAAGGGGRGMRLVENIGDLEGNIELAKSEAKNAFGSSELILEKAIINPRHVEIQIMADNYGNVVSLGERDCSIQRRHQKIIEEAPSPAVNQDLRDEMGIVACQAAKEISYAGAGTVEFLLDNEKNFYFLEMNTRLQVEHPVTEMVTGFDLVDLQFKVADGQTLGISQEDVKMRGHSVEVRLYAEDPSNNFMPSTGQISVWKPESIGICRYDAGIIEGQVISPFYDPMLAKVISYGADRQEAINRLIDSLRETAIFGVNNNRDFLISILKSDAFQSINVDTSFLQINSFEKILEQDMDIAIAAAVFINKIKNKAAEYALGIDLELYGWSNIKSMEHSVSLKLNEQIVVAKVSCESHKEFSVRVRETSFKIFLDYHKLTIDGKEKKLFFSEMRENILCLALEDRQLSIELVSADSKKSYDNDEGSVLSPMHGVISKINVETGELVEKGQLLFVLEAMKMQHEVIAISSGKVKEIKAKVGEQIAADTQILQIEKEK